MESFWIFVALATSIFLEALPFLAIGALVSAAIEVWVSGARLTRWMPRSVLGGGLFGVAAGLVLPTCECGVVPVVRRLIRKGVPPGAALAYLVAAPILNPVVLASTFVAFRGSWAMVGLRALTALVVGLLLALLVGRRRADEVLRAGVLSGGGVPAGGGDHDHAHDPETPRLVAVWLHAGRDFIEMGRYLIYGAVAAALFKTFLPPSALAPFQDSLLLSVLAMMAMAVLLSVCSEADAFVAASFVAFPAAAQLAFIGVGPMVDLKLVGMHVASFRRGVWMMLLVVPVVAVFLISLLVGVVS
jgi:uncharacterized membrane protein YraQ (UPF0718 family)